MTKIEVGKQYAYTVASFADTRIDKQYAYTIGHQESLTAIGLVYKQTIGRDESHPQIGQAFKQVLGRIKPIFEPRPYKLSGALTIVGNIDDVVAPPLELSYEVRINSGLLSDTVTNFPLYIDLSRMPEIFWLASNALGTNIRAMSGPDQIPIDVVGFDKASMTGACFVKVPNISHTQDTALRLEVGVHVPVINPASPMGRAGVWSDYAVAVCAKGSMRNRVNWTDPTILGTFPDLDKSYLPGFAVAVAQGTYAYLADVQGVWTMGYRGNARGQGFNEAMCGVSLNGSNTAHRTSIVSRGNPATINVWNSTNLWMAEGYPYINGRNGRDITAQHFHNGANGRGLYVDGQLVGETSTSAIRPPATGEVNFYIFGPDRGAGERARGGFLFSYLRAGVLSPAWFKLEHLMFENSGLLIIGEGVDTVYEKHTFGMRLNERSPSWNDTTVRQVVQPSAFIEGDYVRIGFAAAGTSGFKVSKAAIAKKGVGAYDFDGPPTRLTFNGGEDGFTLEPNEAILSDRVKINIDGVSPYVISFHIPDVSGYVEPGFSSSTYGSTFTRAYKVGEEVDLVNVTGYSTSGNSSTLIAAIVVGTDMPPMPNEPVDVNSLSEFVILKDKDNKAVVNSLSEFIIIRSE